MLSDTSREAEQVQIELARRATAVEKTAQVRSLTDKVTRLSRRAIARANPGLSPREVDLMWVELNYGKQLAAELRGYLESR